MLRVLLIPCFMILCLLMGFHSSLVENKTFKTRTFEEDNSKFVLVSTVLAFGKLTFRFNYFQIKIYESITGYIKDFLFQDTNIYIVCTPISYNHQCIQMVLVSTFEFYYICRIYSTLQQVH